MYRMFTDGSVGWVITSLVPVTCTLLLWPFLLPSLALSALLCIAKENWNFEYKKKTDNIFHWQVEGRFAYCKHIYKYINLPFILSNRQLKYSIYSRFLRSDNPGVVLPFTFNYSISYLIKQHGKYDNLSFRITSNHISDLCHVQWDCTFWTVLLFRIPWVI